jgi:hypothetical protein
MAALDQLHQPTRALRERARQLRSAIAAPVQGWRIVGLAGLMSLFVAASGAFGSGGISPDLRYPLLIGLGLGLSLLGLGISEAMARIPPLTTRPLARAGAVALAGFASATLICWSLGRLFERASAPGLLAFAGPCALFMAMVAALDLVTRRAAEKRAQRRANAAPLADRLPHRLRPAAILAVQGEDHFVRVHTALGEHLIWMRLADAMAELDSLDGRQTHRSWWVAKSAVSGVRRGNGRATLTLSNGLEAPVSRRFAGELREDGWY